MANRAGDTATSTEVIPAGHAALTAEERTWGAPVGDVHRARRAERGGARRRVRRYRDKPGLHLS